MFNEFEPGLKGIIVPLFVEKKTTAKIIIDEIRTLEDELIGDIITFAVIESSNTYDGIHWKMFRVTVIFVKINVIFRNWDLREKDRFLS